MQPLSLRPPPPAKPIIDPEAIRRGYAHYRPRILFWTTLSYAAFYFVRKNLPIAMPLIEHQLHISKSDLGLFLTLHGVIYGLSKFANGMLADRANARAFLALGLAISAIINVAFGFSSTVVALGVLWMLNGWFQGMGYPPCARLLTHWFAPRELATKMSLWNASHALGGGAIVVLCGYLVRHYGNWRLCFFVPAAIAFSIALALATFLRDTPESVGLPEIEATREPQSARHSFREVLWRRVFSDKYIWLASLANFFVYTIRYAVFDWGPTMLKEFKGVELASASWMVAAFEVAGLAGILMTGWLTDRFFRGRGAPLSMISMLFCALTVLLLWKSPAGALLPNTLLLMAAGFFVYGPQALVAVIVANRATKHAAASAVGLTSVFGYASTVLSGWGLGRLVQHHGWPPVFACLTLAALLGAILFAFALPARVSGYNSPD